MQVLFNKLIVKRFDINEYKDRVMEMVVLVSHSRLSDMRNIKEKFYYYVSNIEGKKRWMNTSAEKKLQLFRSFVIINMIYIAFFKNHFFYLNSNQSIIFLFYCFPRE